MDLGIPNPVLLGRFSHSWSVLHAGEPSGEGITGWAVTSKEEEEQNKAKYLQCILFRFSARGNKGCVCVAGGKRRGDGATTEQGWIIERTLDSIGYSQDHPQ